METARQVKLVTDTKLHRLHWLAFAALIIVPPLLVLLPQVGLTAATLIGYHLDGSVVPLLTPVTRILLLIWLISYVLLADQTVGGWLSKPTIPGMIIVGGAFLIFILWFLVHWAYGIDPVFRGNRRNIPLYVEDGVMEDLSAVALFLGGVFALVAALREFRQNKCNASFMFLVAACCLVLTGEEISWGQRIFQWKTQGVFAEYNVQSETNVHNLLSEGLRNYLTMAIMAWMVIFIARSAQIANSFLWRNAERLVPSLAVQVAFLFAPLAYALANNELAEEVFAWVTLCYAVEIFVKTRKDSSRTQLRIS